MCRRQCFCRLRALILCCALSVPGSAQASDLVSAVWLAEHLDDPELVLLHVGRKEDYEEAHIPGARHVLFDDYSTPHEQDALMLELPSVETLRENLERLGVSSNSRIVVYFGTDWLSPATRLLFTLDTAGLGDRSSLLDGGMPAWLRNGHDVTSEPTEPRSGALDLLTLRPIIVDADFVRAHLHEPGFAVVDGRDAVFYDGVDVGGGHAGQHRRGHIAGAGNLPFGEVVSEELELRTDEELAVLLARAGVAPGDTVIAYCHIGQQATAVLFAAQRLGHPVLLYDGSFEDWSKRGTVYPVENPSAKDPS